MPGGHTTLGKAKQGAITAVTGLQVQPRPVTFLKSDMNVFNQRKTDYRGWLIRTCQPSI